MTRKLIIRRVNGAVFGVRYTSKDNLLLVAGPKRFVVDMYDFILWSLSDYAEWVPKAIKRRPFDNPTTKNKCRITVKILDSMWRHILSRLSSDENFDWKFEARERTRRLMS